MNYSLLEKPRTFQLGPHSLDAFPVLNQDQSHENETKVCRAGRGQGTRWGAPGVTGTHGDVPVPADRVPEGMWLRQPVLQQPPAPEQLGHRAEPAPAQVTAGPCVSPPAPCHLRVPPGVSLSRGVAEPALPAQGERDPGAAVQPGRAEAAPEHQHHQRPHDPLERRGRPRGPAERHRAPQPAALLRPPGTGGTPRALCPTGAGWARPGCS